ncbi:MAG: fructose-bisphosphate aldolase class I [Chloroflexi bacterium]|nr:fructose-bisphosphate aldolase class I [Chloroflexota bacterium]
MDEKTLISTAKMLVAPGKGILAADESFNTIKRRFDAIRLESTEENRRAYREMLFTTPQAEKAISGVILYDETIHQKSKDGVPFPEVLNQKGILPGIKVDTGTVALAGFPGEKVTEGLDGLRDRLQAYRELGARFTKWRAVIAIGSNLPSQTCIETNAHILALYAALCQEADLVPIVEPEVLMDGDHDLQRCEEVTETTLRSVFAALTAQRVLLEGLLLKPNMVISGKDFPQQASVEEVAATTVRCLRRVVPAAVPGVVFLSGGQTPEQATAHLNAMNRMGGAPWELSFSYGRALQDPVLRAWDGKAANTEIAQRIFYHRSALNSAARQGKYTPWLEAEAS